MSVDDDYYYTKSVDALTSKLYRESVQHEIEATTYSGQQIVYDVSRNAGGLAKNHHLFRLEDGVYDTMYSYNFDESAMFSTSPKPTVNVYQYCLSSYDEENKEYNVVVTDDSGLQVNRVTKVVFEHDIDSATGYKYNVFREEAQDFHWTMHADFLSEHHEIVEYQYWMRAAAEATARHFEDSETLKLGYTIDREEFHRFWGKWTYTNIDEDVSIVSCTTVENRDYQLPAFDCKVVQEKTSRTVVVGRAYAFVERIEGRDGYSMDVSVNSDYNQITRHVCDVYPADDETVEEVVCDDKGFLKAVEAKEIVNFQTGSHQGSTENIYNTDFAVAVFADAYDQYLHQSDKKEMFKRADYHDLRAFITDIDENTVHVKAAYYDFYYEVDVARTEDKNVFEISEQIQNAFSVR